MGDTDTTASVPLMLNPKQSPKLKPPLLPNPKLMPMPTTATDIPDTDTVLMGDTTVIPDTVMLMVIITASDPLNPKPTDITVADTDTVTAVDTDTVDTDMAVMVIMVNFAQDQVTRISKTPRKSGPKKKNTFLSSPRKIPFFFLSCKSKRTE